MIVFLSIWLYALHDFLNFVTYSSDDPFPKSPLNAPKAASMKRIIFLRSNVAGLLLAFINSAYSFLLMMIRSISPPYQKQPIPAILPFPCGTPEYTNGILMRSCTKSSQPSAEGVPPMADITDAELQKLLNEGLSQNEIARRTNIPRSTLRRRLEKLGIPQVHKSVPNEGTPNVYKGTHIPDEHTETEDEIQEMLAWFREHKRALQPRDDPEQETQRQTYHAQKRYIEAIKRAADLERVSIMEIVNRAFGYYFSREHN